MGFDVRRLDYILDFFLLLMFFFMVVPFVRCNYRKEFTEITEHTKVTELRDPASLTERREPIEFSMSNTVLMKGICAVIILLHHITQQVKGNIFINWGYLGVAGFLFISGFGLTCQWKKKGNKYAIEILKTSIPNLFRICILTIAIMSVYYLLQGDKITWTDLLGILKGNRLLNWFFPYIIAVYLFYVIAIIVGSSSRKNRNSTLVENIPFNSLKTPPLFKKRETQLRLLFNITVLIIIWTLFLIFLSRSKIIGQHWYMSNFAFGGGVCCSIYQDTLWEKFCLHGKHGKHGKIKKMLIEATLLCITAVLFFCVHYMTSLDAISSSTASFSTANLDTANLSTHNLGTVNLDSLPIKALRLLGYFTVSTLFSFMLFIFCYEKNSFSILKLCGKRSAEMILTQGIALNLWRSSFIWIDNAYLYTILAVVTQFLLVIIFSPIFDFVKNARGIKIRKIR